MNKRIVGSWNSSFLSGAQILPFVDRFDRVVELENGFLAPIAADSRRQAPIAADRDECIGGYRHLSEVGDGGYRQLSAVI